ncbi:unnamed protein product [Moneuplotes crassus]|uniref:Uncharacterized protein n=1 Tax=Euplotes crassus TaxID=5936 RepID=A0AAD1XXS0_EUPCR|nr:unnamed protein product [Moneuplotes crassus]
MVFLFLPIDCLESDGFQDHIAGGNTPSTADNSKHMSLMAATHFQIAYNKVFHLNQVC